MSSASSIYVYRFLSFRSGRWSWSPLQQRYSILFELKPSEGKTTTETCFGTLLSKHCSSARLFSCPFTYYTPKRQKISDCSGTGSCNQERLTLIASWTVTKNRSRRNSSHAESIDMLGYFFWASELLVSRGFSTLRDHAVANWSNVCRVPCSLQSCSRQIHCATATEYLDRSNPATFIIYIWHCPPHSTREVTFDLIPGFVTRVFFLFQMDVDPAVRLPEAPVDTS